MKFKSQNRTGSTSVFAIGGLLMIVAIGGAAYWWINRDGGMAADEPITREVFRGDFVAQVLDQGEVQSSENVEIRCEVRARNGAVKVIKLVPEGTKVKGGDFLVGLDSTSFEKERDTQVLAVTNAETAVMQANAALAAAEKSWEEYEKGIFEESKLQIENELFAAEQEVQQAQANLEHTQKLYKKGFTTAQILRTNEIAVAKAKNAVTMAKKKLYVLQEITLEKNKITFESDIEAARVQVENAKKELQMQKDQLAEMEEMIAACTITVPGDVAGEVVYAKESSRRGDDWMLELGAEVRENQVLIRLPNPKKMEFKALINEQSITSIRPNMPAKVNVDALNGIKLKGIVTKVNQYAENNGWMGGNIRKYAVFVRIIDPPTTLIPGMNGSATIQTQHAEDVLQIPIQSIYAVNNQRFVLIKKDDKWITREIEINGDNSQFAWVVEKKTVDRTNEETGKEEKVTIGVDEGDTVALNPGAYRDLMVLPEVANDTNIELPDDVERVPEDQMQNGGQGGMRDDRGGRGGDGRGRGGSGGRGNSGGMGNVDGMIDGMMQRYDTNSDGKIDKDEMAGLDDRAKGMVERADSNSDGEITKDELKSGMENMMRQRQQQGGGPGGGRR